MKWYEMSVQQKGELIMEEWERLKLRKFHFFYAVSDLEDQLGPVQRDGHITLYLADITKSIQLSSMITYRSLTYNNRGYVSHVIKTLAHEVAKKYFGLKE